MLDLISIKKPTLPVKISDVLSVTLLPTSKELVDKMQEFKKNTGSHNSAELYQLAAAVLSDNTEKKTVTTEDIKHLDLYVIKELFREYQKFIKEINADPN